MERMIQQMILNVLQPKFDPTFSEHSYGFRPGRSAHEAVSAARQYIQEGRRWVVDVDLEKFFDRVNHDILMSRLAKRIEDKRMLGLIRRYLEAGLDEIDQELEKRGHPLVRYADDGNVYVRSERAAEDVMATLKRLYAKLRLKINGTKSRITRVWASQYVGYGFWVAKGKIVKHGVGAKALRAMKERVREITLRSGGRSMQQAAGRLKGYLNGWREYFWLSETPGVFAELDEWIGHRLRMVRLKQWKRGTTIFRELRALGESLKAAASVSASPRSWWKMFGTSALNLALPNTYFATLGVPRLADNKATF
jgi:hypothetical protein